jgi:hypothetical protein
MIKAFIFPKIKLAFFSLKSDLNVKTSLNGLNESEFNA